MKIYVQIMFLKIVICTVTNMVIQIHNLTYK